MVIMGTMSSMRILCMVAVSVAVIARMRVCVIMMIGRMSVFMRVRVRRYIGVMPVVRMVRLVSSHGRMACVHLRQCRLACQPLFVREIGQLMLQLGHRERLFRIRRVHDVGPDTPEGAILGLSRRRAGSVEDVAEFGVRGADLQPVRLSLVGKAITETTVVFPQFVAQPDHGIPPSSSRVRVHGWRRLQE